ncbi:sodium:glutamate symporter [Gallibacterium salpingitidis]|uniref:Sodium/glutamate symporter n=1 Tax=Gallibacterium salpingitidis TaxID=505341 RepID=A0AB36E3Q9_9PAST|nr:sodium/glutamate symporter [Gallibacterium salpingitidis]OBX06548.1 sodium:glutamate symporter [Gallibacterium salpingitidis]OBX11378.1 sodium:glutamate symporter [Gallibacterium salpingitidis]
MILIKVGMFQTLAIAILAIYLGEVIRNLFTIIKKYCIPSPVIGGTLFALITTLLYLSNISSFEFDYKTINSFFYNIFFAATGLAASVKLLKKGGKIVIIFSILAALLAILQNILSLGVGILMDMNPLVALMSGSVPLTGGHGNAASFAPLAEQMGGEGAIEVAVASATFGLIAGCILGGPLGRGLIHSYQLNNTQQSIVEETDPNHNKQNLVSYKRSTKAAFILLLACGLGQTMFVMFKHLLPQINMPIHVMCMLSGIIIRVILDTNKKNNEALYQSIGIIGEISLAIFVSVVIITMQLWKLIDLAVPLLIILALQVLLCYLFCIWITFRLCGKNFDSAIIATGHSGFGLGAVPVSMATMTAVCSKYGYSKLAFFVVPLIGGFISNISNALIITFFLNFAQKLL